MKEAFLALLGAGLTIAGCYALGALILDRLHASLHRFERFPLAFVLGAACLHLCVFATLALRIAYWPLVIALPVASIGVAIWKGSWKTKGERFPALDTRLVVLWTSLFAIFTVLYFFNALAPESSPDGSGYHLSLVNRYMHAHRFEPITTNFYASLSQGIEMLYLPAFIVGRHSSAALVHLGFLIALCLAIFAYGRRLGKPWVGAAASLFTYLSPVAGLDGTIAYNDVGVAAIVFSCFYWLEIWDDSRENRLLIPIGLLAGYAYAAKYTAFTILPFALLFVLIKSRKWKPALTVAALSMVMVAPWMIKNQVFMQNPLAPFLNKYFRNPYVHVQFEKEYAANLRHYEVTNKWTLPWEVTVSGQKTTGLIGPLFLLLPLALLSLRYREGRRLLAAGAFVFAPYFLNIGTRFLIPSLPFFSLAIALSAGPWPPLLAALMVFHAAASWPDSIHLYSGKYAWRLDQIKYKEALRLIPQDQYLRQTDPPYAVARMVEAHVPKGERVLAMNGIPEAYTNREILTSFQSAFNESLSDTFNMGWITDFQPVVLRSLRFPSISARKVRLTQTGQGANQEQWSIHELRFFSNGAELSRSPNWRLTAFPNPWDIQQAFDNSPATRWRSWEEAFPGMYVEVDFGAPVPLEEVHIETSPDFVNIKIQTEVLDASGKWVKLGDDMGNSPITVKSNIRRAATWEMHLRGVNYLLIGDTDYGSLDVRDDPAAWGLRQIAAVEGVRLYEVLPLSGPEKSASK